MAGSILSQTQVARKLSGGSPVLGFRVFCFCQSPSNSASSKSFPWDSSIAAHWGSLIDGISGTSGLVLHLIGMQPPYRQAGHTWNFSPLFSLPLEPTQGGPHLFSSICFNGASFCSLSKWKMPRAPTGRDRANARSSKTSSAPCLSLFPSCFLRLLRCPSSPELDLHF